MKQMTETYIHGEWIQRSKYDLCAGYELLADYPEYPSLQHARQFVVVVDTHLTRQ
jgi:hypothetical protein